MLRLVRLTSPLLLLAAVGCTELGERAGSGQCPDDPCSPTTPEGLEFGGPPFGGLWFGERDVKTTAVGGVQLVELIDHATGRALAAAYGAHTVGAALEVVETAEHVVTLSALDAGTGLLRVDDDQGLLDQLEIDAAPIAEISLEPDGQVVIREDWTRPWLVWAGADANLTVALHAEDGRRLVDQELTVTAGDATSLGVVTWDVRRLRVGEAGVSLSVRAGDLAEPVVLAVAATNAVDAIRSHPLSDGQAGGAQVLCFEASAAGTEVVYVPWTFSGSAGVKVEPFLSENCALIESETAGGFDVTATIPGGLSETVRVQFVAPTGGRRSRSAAPAAVGPSLGERAGG